jgi:hypothetical protein
MNAIAVSRLMSLIPDRAARVQSGSVFSPSEAAACRYPDRLSYMGRFLHWLGPLDPMTKEDQQFLGVRSSGGRPMMAGEEQGEELGDEIDDLDDDLHAEPSMQIPDSGTAIAQPSLPSTVGG